MWHFILDEKPLKGSWNMAVDDFLFNSLSENPETCLRFYSWKNPTVSLGYSQSVKRVVNRDFCRKRGIEIVRRITGGKLVLHHKEATYSICSSDTELFSVTLADSYRLISEALMNGLKNMGLAPRLATAPPVSYVKGNLPCFSYPAKNEIEIKGMKIVGSAQKRRGKKFLQHGSLPLETDDAMQMAVASSQKIENLQMLSLSQALGKRVTFGWAAEHLAEGISEYFGVQLRPKVFDSEEMAFIRKLQKEKYENPDWTGL